MRVPYADPTENTPEPSKKETDVTTARCDNFIKQFHSIGRFFVILQGDNGISAPQITSTTTPVDRQVPDGYGSTSDRALVS